MILFCTCKQSFMSMANVFLQTKFQFLWFHSTGLGFLSVIKYNLCILLMLLTSFAVWTFIGSACCWKKACPAMAPFPFVFLASHFVVSIYFHLLSLCICFNSFGSSIFFHSCHCISCTILMLTLIVQ